MVFLAENQRRLVHHLQAAPLRFFVGEVSEQLRGGVDARVVVVDAVHVLGQQNGVGFDFDCAKRRRRVGREERAAAAAGEQHDAPLLKVADGVAGGVGFGKARHRNGAHVARVQAELRERILHGGAVDGGAEHPHVVGVDGVHAGGRAFAPAPDVARTDDDGHLNPFVVQALERRRDAVNLCKVKENSVFAQRFAGKFNQYALVHAIHSLKKGAAQRGVPFCFVWNYFTFSRFAAISAAKSSLRFSMPSPRS